MKKFKSGAAFAISVLALASLGYGQMQQAARLVLTSNSFDFGRVTEGRIVDHIFKFTNAGDAVLRIQKVKGT